ncbi:MAG: universal stress protein [Frankiaceae bacterium]|nr:universal stress protein [Frankiaceae bacterium]
MTSQQVLVGVDDSPASDAALAWALNVAARTGDRVEALHAWQWTAGMLGVIAPDAPATLAVAARHAAHAAVAKAVADRPFGAQEVEATARTAEGDAASRLLEEAGTSALLVLGRHGQSTWSRRLVGQALGSVASACLSGSTVPVAIVPQDAVAAPPERVVVGVDGSRASERALRWAVEHARSSHSPVLAVLAWQLTTLPAPPVAREDRSVPPLTEWEDLARTLLHDTVAHAVGDADVEEFVLHRPAAAGLLEAVRPADLLVLGERGRGGFTRLLLGSVSRQCAEHAPCPVVVVPPRERAV